MSLSSSFSVSKSIISIGLGIYMKNVSNKELLS
jgi:hypothetical protein